jgi:hypothetical protein
LTACVLVLLHMVNHSYQVVLIPWQGHHNI